MLNVYCKNMKKSIHIPERIDIFLIFVLVILIASPFIIRFFFGVYADNKQINLFLSPRFEDMFGKELTETLLNEFAEQNPDSRIKVMAFTDEKSSSPREPDILIFDDGDYNTLVAGGLLAKIPSYFFNETDISSLTADQLAIPLVSFMDMFFYNIEILTAVGFDRPPKTREEFLACARAVSGIINSYPSTAVSSVLSLALKDSPSRDIFSWIWAGGGDFWQEKNWPVLNTRVITGDISFFGTLYRENILTPVIFNRTGEQRLEEFVAGRTAMIIASTRDIPYLRERMGEYKFGITTIPNSGLSGRYNINLSGIYAGINLYCEHQEEARNFLVFLAGKSKLFCDIFKAVPGMVSDIVLADYIRDDPFYSKARDIFESSVIVQGFSGIPGAVEYENAFMEELRAFFSNNRTPLETVNAIQKRWDETLNNAQR
jgi:ABC-type glycerol-3-phosphate transport system substrate-binding protein